MDKKVEINIKDCSERFVAVLDEEILNNLNDLNFIMFKDISYEYPESEYIILNTKAIAWMVVYEND
ncbi:hypothetical protein [Ligilactobacillus agilis]|uniref:hypothetical protein n=1 Tax=Ligilactobacillus agilis TaxID=1601 RepID=UPI00320872E5